MASQTNLSDNKSHQVSRTLLVILVDFNIGVVWMVSIHRPISKSFSPLSKPLKQFQACQLQLVSSSSTSSIIISSLSRLK